MKINNLRVNGIIRPLGVDTQRPRLSWQISQIPTQYQIKVAHSKNELAHDEQLIWDSGIIRGSLLHVDYDGPFLTGNTRYWWKVCVWDANGKSAESEAAMWETGLFEEDWTAEWIWRSDQVVQNEFAYFRKEFDINKPVEHAKLYVSAHHTAKVYVNAKRLGGYGSPAPTHPWKRKYYLAYDITESLDAEKNVIAAAAHYLGGGGQNYVNGLPGFRMQLHITYSDGTVDIVATDSSWQTLLKIPHRQETPYQQNRKISAIEDYDAREYDEKWLLPGFSEELCQRAVIANINKEDWPMKWQEIPEGKIDEEIAPTRVLSNTGQDEGHDVQVFDAGKIISGWPRISLSGLRLAGCTIRMRYSEDLDEFGRVKHNVANETSEYYYDQYTVKGMEWEKWSPDLSYKAFRYVEITGYPGRIEPGKNLVICSAHTGMDKQGDFHCSDPFLNAMYAACIQTQKNNVLGQVVDCPHREQAQYLADTDLQAEAMIYNFDAIHVLEKTLSDFADGQRENGLFPFVLPTNADNPRFNIHIPEWDLHYCTLLWKVYQKSGDERLLKRYYEPMKKMIDHYVGTIDPVTGLIPKKEESWHISDWPYPTVDHTGSFYTVQQVKAWQGLRIVSETAGMLGYEQEAKEYAGLASQLHDQIVEHLYDREQKYFRDSDQSKATHQGVNALALYAGIDVGDDRSEVLVNVANQQWESKTVLSLPLFRLLFENGFEEKAYQLMRQKEYPGWGHMIAQGAKTMWEGWDDIESHSHAWNGYPARLMQEYIAGIQAADVAFEKVHIKPYIPDDLQFAEATVSTIHGNIYTRWQREGHNVIRMRIQIPATVTAQLTFKAPSGSILSEIHEQTYNGNHLEINESIAVLDLDPGEYDFRFAVIHESEVF